MITHDEIRKLLNTTEMNESPTRSLERKLLIHDYVDQQETLQTEYEALVKDVARYFKLAQKFKSITKENQIECYQLQDKLLKVGK